MADMEIREQVPLAPYTTFQIGGNARYFIEVAQLSQLGAALDYAHTRHLPFFILGGGSNVLVADEGFEGVVIQLSFGKVEVDYGARTVAAQAGSALRDVIHEAASAGLSGMESLYGIPGTVGGAVRGNAGAFGVDVKDVLEEAVALNIQTREVRTFSNAACHFAYRNSFFKQHADWIVLSATFSLAPDEDGTVRERANKVLAERNKRQIQDIRSAGSYFMNPVVHEGLRSMFQEEKGEPARENRVPAGWLIEKVGLKDYCEGGACTGARSANYIINDGTATAAAVQALAQKIRTTVGDRLGVELHEEVTRVGL